MKKARILIVIVCVMAVMNVASAETIRGINIDFVNIGYAGNAGDTRGAGQGNYANPYGCGAVSYDYRIGKYEVTNAQWNAFTAIAGVPTGDGGGYSYSSRSTGDQEATNNVSWYEAAQFCNYLTSGDKSKGVYQFSGNNANPGSFIGINRDAAKTTYGTTYFLPTEDEWYKAAYYTGGYCPRYSLYANGTNIAPVGCVNTNYLGPCVSPWNVGTGTQEQNGTFDMMGNLWEMTECRVIRGGSSASERGYLGSSGRYGGCGVLPPDGELYDTGFRVASTIPEPDTLLLHAPNGSESICAGTIYTISWSSTGSISNVLIEYSTNNGSSWTPINNIPDTDSYNWLVPTVNSNQCLVRISDGSHPAIYDISDSTFEITIPKTITISSPNGGESLISGGEQLIQWSNTGTISGILIEYSVNNGLNWFPVAPANIGNSGSYEWLVPNYNSDQCLMRVSAVDATDVNDVSDNVFTIGPENPSEYPTLYEILGGTAPNITESGRDFVTLTSPDANLVAFILLESAGFANENVFGIYSAYDPQQKLQLFSGSDSPTDTTTVKFNFTDGNAENLQTGQTANIGKFFGFYLTTPQNGGITYYTDLTRNPDSSEHGLIFNTSGFAGVIENDPDTVIAFEDFLGLGDKDYNDMVVGIINAVPLPGTGPYCIRDIPGDVNHDCKVDYEDFAIMASHWLECNLDPQSACWQ